MGPPGRSRLSAGRVLQEAVRLTDARPAHAGCASAMLPSPFWRLGTVPDLGVSRLEPPRVRTWGPVFCQATLFPLSRYGIICPMRKEGNQPFKLPSLPVLGLKSPGPKPTSIRPHRFGCVLLLGDPNKLVSLWFPFAFPFKHPKRGTLKKDTHVRWDCPLLTFT